MNQPAEAPKAMSYNGTQEAFLDLPLVKSSFEEDGRGDLWRIEVRKDPDTGLTLKRRSPVSGHKRR